MPHAALATLTAHANVRRLLAPAILVGASLNGFAVHVADALQGERALTVLLGVSPFDAITLAVAAALLAAQTDELPERLGPVEILTLVLIAIPSSAFSWLAVFLYSARLALKTTGSARAGAILFAGLGLTSLWASIGIRLAEAEITSLEALIVSNILMLFRGDVGLSGNLVGILDGHRIALLPACATAYLMPKAILATTALTRMHGPLHAQRALPWLALAALTLALLNWARLAAMSTSAENYEFLHGPFGANLFDLAQSAVLFFGAVMAARDD